MAPRTSSSQDLGSRRLPARPLEGARHSLVRRFCGKAPGPAPASGSSALGTRRLPRAGTEDIWALGPQREKREVAGAAPTKGPLGAAHGSGASPPPCSARHLLAHTRRPDCHGLRGGSGGRWAFRAWLGSSVGIQGGPPPPSPASGAWGCRRPPERRGWKPKRGPGKSPPPTPTVS